MPKQKSKKNYMTTLYIILGILLVIWIAWSFFSVYNIEEPKYSVVEKKDFYEIRLYEPMILATTEISGGTEEGLNSGFMVIADYIFGNNTSKDSIAMTAPVGEKQSEKIAMTTPVTDSNVTGGNRIMSFVMPSKYTMETLPKPNDKRVKLVEMPARKMAVHRFSWFSTDKKVKCKKDLLLKALTKDNIQTNGPVEGAFYNPPWTIPFMKRNEVMVEVL